MKRDYPARQPNGTFWSWRTVRFHTWLVWMQLLWFMPITALGGADPNAPAAVPEKNPTLNPALLQPWFQQLQEAIRHRQQGKLIQYLDLAAIFQHLQQQQILHQFAADEVQQLQAQLFRGVQNRYLAGWLMGDLRQIQVERCFADGTTGLLVLVTHTDQQNLATKTVYRLHPAQQSDTEQTNWKIWDWYSPTEGVGVLDLLSLELCAAGEWPTADLQASERFRQLMLIWQAGDLATIRALLEPELPAGTSPRWQALRWHYLGRLALLEQQPLPALNAFRRSFQMACGALNVASPDASVPASTVAESDGWELLQAPVWEYVTPWPRALLPSLPLDVARALNQLGQYEAALSHLAQAEHWLGLDASICQERGIAYQRLGQLAAARDSYAQGWALDNRRLENWIGWLEVEPNSALQQLAEFWKKQPEPEQSFPVLATALYQRQEGAALLALCAVAQNRPESAPPAVLQFWEALAHLQLGHAERAWGQLDQLWNGTVVETDRAFYQRWLWSAQALSAAVVERYNAADDPIEQFPIFAEPLLLAIQNSPTRDAKDPQSDQARLWATTFPALLAAHRVRKPDDPSLAWFTGQWHQFRQEKVMAHTEYKAGLAHFTAQANLEQNPWWSRLWQGWLDTATEQRFVLQDLPAAPTPKIWTAFAQQVRDRQQPDQLLQILQWAGAQWDSTERTFWEAELAFLKQENEQTLQLLHALPTDLGESFHERRQELFFQTFLQLNRLELAAPIAWQLAEQQGDPYLLAVYACRQQNAGHFRSALRWCHAAGYQRADLLSADRLNQELQAANWTWETFWPTEQALPRLTP